MNLTKAPAIMILITLLSASLAGCIGNDNDKSKDTKSTLTIAYYLAEDSSENVSIYDVDSPMLKVWQIG